MTPLARRGVVFLGLGLCLAGAPARSLAGTGSVHTPDPLRDGLLLGGVLGGVLLLQPWEGLGLAESSSVAVDSSATAPYQNPVPGIAWARSASDALLYALLVSPLWVGAIDLASSEVDKPFLRLGEDSLMAYEALGLTLVGTLLLKELVGRKRPHASATSTDPDVDHSFPSGHTSMSFAAAAAGSSTLFRRHGAAAGAWGAALGLHGAALAVGFFRVLGGRHFPTDVLAGAALGLAFGYGVSALHSRSSGGDLAITQRVQVPWLRFGGAF